MTKKSLQEMIAQIDGIMGRTEKGTEDYMTLWRMQARAKAELAKIQRANDMQMLAFELARKAA
jgi:hypothetical protein